MQSHGVKRTHAESENEFNVTVQLKASEGATETLVGRWELSRLLTSHCARLMANLSTHMHKCKHTNFVLLPQSHPFMWTATLDNTEPKQMPTDTHPHTCLKSFILSTPHFFSPSFPVVVRCTASETASAHLPLTYPLPPASLSLQYRQFHSRRKHCHALHTVVSGWKVV